MKRLVVLLGLLGLLSGALPAADLFSTTSQIASRIYVQLSLDTTGTNAYPRAIALSHAREGLYQCGLDLGIPFMKVVPIAAESYSVKVDTALIAVSYVVRMSDFDGIFTSPVPAGIVRNAPLDSILQDIRYKRNDAGDFEANLDAPEWWHQQPGSDSIIFASSLLGADTLLVLGYLRDNPLTDTTATTSIPQDYRRGAILYGLYLASERLQNGRETAFEERYYAYIARIWMRRMNPFHAMEDKP